MRSAMRLLMAVMACSFIASGLAAGSRQVNDDLSEVKGVLSGNRKLLQGGGPGDNSTHAAHGPKPQDDGSHNHRGYDSHQGKGPKHPNDAGSPMGAPHDHAHGPAPHHPHAHGPASGHGPHGHGHAQGPQADFGPHGGPHGGAQGPMPHHGSHGGAPGPKPDGGPDGDMGGPHDGPDGGHNGGGGPN